MPKKKNYHKRPLHRRLIKRIISGKMSILFVVGFLLFFAALMIGIIYSPTFYKYSVLNGTTYQTVPGSDTQTSGTNLHIGNVQLIQNVTPTQSISVPNPPPNTTTANPPLNSSLCEGGADDDGHPQPDNCQCAYSTIRCAGHKVVDCQQGANDRIQACSSSIAGIPDLADQRCNYYQYDGKYCIGKPVIYLYPVKSMDVSVKLTTLGSLTVAIPFPNLQNSQTYTWQDIFARPDGTLEYQNNTYHELYYETAVTKISQPRSGILLDKQNLKQELTDITTKLGLLPKEQQEFLDYWIPKVQIIPGSDIFFSVLPTEEKDSVDHVEITPKPDTEIEFLVYFKSYEKPFTFSHLTLPPTPKRTGFTAVEWGGTIDKF